MMMTCLKSVIAAGSLAALSLSSAAAQGAKPGEVGFGIFTFTSGPAAAYGMPGRNAAELLIEQINGADGIGVRTSSRSTWTKDKGPMALSLNSAGLPRTAPMR